MRYGHFDDVQREYVIERPDTPAPWLNYLGEGDYCGLISNNAGGYSFRRSAAHGRLLRYRFNAVPADRPGRYIYLRDESDDFWSVSWQPVHKPLEQQRVICRHGLGYTLIESEYRSVSSAALYFVPENEQLEVWCLELVNRARHTRMLDVFAYAEFGFPDFAGEADLQYYLYTMFGSCHDGIVGMHMNRVRPEARDAYFACLAPVESFDAQRDSFIGPWRDESNPLAVARGRCANHVGHGDNVCGALHTRVRLSPGVKWRTAFLLGSGRPEVEGVRARTVFTVPRILEEHAALRTRWQRRLEALQCLTPAPELNRMVNVWNAYQAHTTFKWSRSASFVEAGGRDGFGYRDTLQDLIGAMHTSAPRARQIILELLRGQSSRGCALHSVQPLTLTPGQGQQPPAVWSDDHLWIAFAAGAYLRETGDASFLTEHAPYLDTGTGAVYEHVRKGIEFAHSQRGARGLLLGLCADWNDSLNLRRSQGESVFTSQLFCAALHEFAQFADLLGQTKDALVARQWYAGTAELINRVAWDGQWYLRALLGDGTKIGSASNAAGALFLESQVWAVLSGVADPARGRQALDAVRQHLHTPFGILLCTPPYTQVDDRIGGMTYFPPGFKENGSIFCHAHTWAIIAEALLGRGERAFEYYQELLPFAQEERSERRMVEPYVYCQFIKGPADPAFGQGRNPWLTGTAAWAYAAATQYILGVRPALSGLAVDPCIPSAWTEFRVVRVFRGATYEITVRNPRHVNGGVRETTVAGRKIAGCIIPPAPKGSVVKVEVELTPGSIQ